MQGLPASFSGIDEWYTFNYGLTWPDVHVIYNLDETTLGTPMQTPMNPHPAVWYRTDSRGTKYFYGIIIHDPTGITSTTDFFQNLTLRALEWEAGYAPVPIVNGHPLKPKGVICMCLANRDLQVHAHGAYTLNVWSPQGKLLYSVKNSTASIHRIPAFSKPGMYLAKIESGEGSFSQRVMVY